MPNALTPGTVYQDCVINNWPLRRKFVDKWKWFYRFSQLFNNWEIALIGISNVTPSSFDRVTPTPIPQPPPLHPAPTLLTLFRSGVFDVFFFFCMPMWKKFTKHGERAHPSGLSIRHFMMGGGGATTHFRPCRKFVFAFLGDWGTPTPKYGLKMILMKNNSCYTTYFVL